jgi:Uma2 family endonuclease
MSTIARFSVEEYDQLIERGAFDGERRRRLELIHGELREMSPIGPEHEDIVDLLTRWSFSVTRPDEVRVRVQNSVGLLKLASVPEPDLAWVNEKSYRQGRPKAADVLLIIEVAKTSRDYDLGEKADLYAAAGIREYWVVDIGELRLVIHRDPRRGRYGSIESHSGDAEVAPESTPGAKLRLRQLFAV